MANAPTRMRRKRSRRGSGTCTRRVEGVDAFANDQRRLRWSDIVARGWALTRRIFNTKSFAITLWFTKASVATAWSDYPLVAERTAPRNVPRCYTVCPPPIFPNAPDPFYQSPFHLYQLEHPSVAERIMNPLQEGLPGRLQQVAGDPDHPVAGFWCVVIVVRYACMHMHACLRVAVAIAHPCAAHGCLTLLRRSVSVTRPGVAPLHPSIGTGFGGVGRDVFMAPPTHAMIVPGRKYRFPATASGPYGAQAGYTSFVDVDSVSFCA